MIRIVNADAADRGLYGAVMDLMLVESATGTTMSPVHEGGRSAIHSCMVSS